MKKILLCTMLLSLMLVCFGCISTYAAQYGYLDYEISDGKVVITRCDTSATEVVIPDEIENCPVEGIRVGAFSSCKNLVSIDIPSSITYIGNTAFTDCNNLTRVDIHDITSWCNISFGGSSASPLSYAKKLYLNGILVENLVIPNSVSSIKKFAFSGCESFRTVEIPESVVEIGNFAFENCCNIININIPKDIESIGISVFENCKSLYNINIPENIVSIENSAFEGCESLTNLELPQNVKMVGSRTFWGCENLKNVSIPSSITSIGREAFSGCETLDNVYITDIESWCKIDFASSGSNPMAYAEELVLNNDNIISLNIPDDISEIKPYAFYGCNNIISLTLPKSLNAIGESAFYGCTKLQLVDVPKNVTVIGKNAFSFCHGLTEIVIPDNVIEIGEGVFYNCSNLINVVIGKGVELIPQYSFQLCVDLKYVCIPANVLIVKNNAFNNCTSIEMVFYDISDLEWKNILFYSGNENLTNANIVYNATKKVYKFETNCDKALNDITDYAIFIMPTVENDGKTLTGWYDNAALSGNPVTFPYYGNATTLYAAWTDKTGKGFDDAFIAKANQEYTVTTTESGQLVYFEFVPKCSKEYRFYTTGSKDTYGYLYNSNQSRLASNDDDGDGNNFNISYSLTAGETYYIVAKMYGGMGTFALVVEEPIDYRINEITTKDMSGNNLQTIPTGHFLATVSFTKVSSSADTVIILAQYTDAGAFKGLMYIQTEDVPTGSTIKLSIPVDNSKGDVAKLKAFCWESFGSLIPMGNSVSFPVE